MKLVSTLLAVLLLSAQVAHAKPLKKATPVEPTKDAFKCEIVKLHMVMVPKRVKRIMVESYNALLRVSCTNTSSKPLRFRSADLFMDDGEYETRASCDPDTFNAFYSGPGVTMACDGFIDIAPSKTIDFALFFEDTRSAYGVDLTLDMYGEKYPFPVLPH